jgi:hypothetical protein
MVGQEKRVISAIAGISAPDRVTRDGAIGYSGWGPIRSRVPSQSAAAIGDEGKDLAAHGLHYPKLAGEVPDKPNGAA